MSLTSVRVRLLRQRDPLLFLPPQRLSAQGHLGRHLADRPPQLRDLPDRVLCELVRQDPPMDHLRTPEIEAAEVSVKSKPLQCAVLVRLLKLESPKRIASARGRTVDHIRNVINNIVHKAHSTDGVPGVIIRAAAALMPHDPPASLEAIHRIIAWAQQRRQ